MVTSIRSHSEGLLDPALHQVHCMHLHLLACDDQHHKAQPNQATYHTPSEPSHTVCGDEDPYHCLRCLPVPATGSKMTAARWRAACLPQACLHLHMPACQPRLRSPHLPLVLALCHAAAKHVTRQLQQEQTSLPGAPVKTQSTTHHTSCAHYSQSLSWQPTGGIACAGMRLSHMASKSRVPAQQCNGR